MSQMKMKIQKKYNNIPVASGIPTIINKEKMIYIKKTLKQTVLNQRFMGRRGIIQHGFLGELAFQLPKHWKDFKNEDWCIALYLIQFHATTISLHKYLRSHAAKTKEDREKNIDINYELIDLTGLNDKVTEEGKEKLYRDD